MNATTEFDRFKKHAFQILYAGGTAHNYFAAQFTDNCYLKPVKPDFILPDKTWIDLDGPKKLAEGQVTSFRYGYSFDYDQTLRPINK